MSFCQITCQCGHSADYIEFTRTLLNGDLPPGEFQCPGCGWAWKRQESGYRVLRAGAESMVIPTRLDIVTIESRM